MDIVFGIILLVAAVFLIIAVLMQSGKSEGLSGSIAGGSSSDTFFGKTKGKSMDKLLSRLTTIVAIVFVVLVIVVYVIQDDTDLNAIYKDYLENLTSDTTVASSDDDEPAETTGSSEEQQPSGEDEQGGESDEGSDDADAGSADAE